VLYVNDIIDEVRSHIRLYADDATVFLDFEDPDLAADQMEEDLERVMRWASRWLITFNPAKTVSVTFSRKRETEIPVITMGGVEVHEANKQKHLGTTLHCTAKWAEHINEICLRARKRVDILRGLMYRLDRRTLEIMYFTYVRPILEISDVVFDNCTMRDSDKLEEVQRASARVVQLE
jgi:hypothetical protein